MDRFKAFWLAPLIVLGFAMAHGPAHGAAAPPSLQKETPASEPERAPAQESGGALEGPADEAEGLPGRDDPEEFYKKPPRKPKLRTNMYA